MNLLKSILNSSLIVLIIVMFSVSCSHSDDSIIEETFSETKTQVTLTEYLKILEKKKLKIKDSNITKNYQNQPCLSSCNGQIRTPIAAVESCENGYNDGSLYSIAAVATQTMNVDREVSYGLFIGGVPYDGGTLIIPAGQTKSINVPVLRGHDNVTQITSSPLQVYITNQGASHLFDFIPITVPINTCGIVGVILDPPNYGEDCWSQLLEANSNDDEDFSYGECVTEALNGD